MRDYAIKIHKSSFSPKPTLFSAPLQMDPPSLPVENNVVRRSANYHPAIWSNDYVQSLKSNYAGESFAKRLEKLKEKVRMMLDAVVEPLNQLELIDTLQRLGVSYHFEEEIKRILNAIHNSNHSNYEQKQDGLYAIALEFRLLRQHGYNKSPEIFNNFRDEKGNFNPSLYGDCKAILYLYEAAYLLEEGEESIFYDTRNFTTAYLKEYVKLQHGKDEYLSTLAKHSLQIPLYWRMVRLEARWFVGVYERSHNMNPLLVEFAKLDYNVVQATHQEDLKDVSRWWTNTRLGEKLSFVRDRVMEFFLWAVGSAFEPQFGYCRRLLAKLTGLVTVIDDIYDVYGTLDELELFTNAIERWDLSAMDQLPNYMRISYLALHNSINEIAYDALIEQEIHVIPYLKKAWADLCKGYLVEAKWYHSGYTPTLGEYMENALISVGSPLIQLHAYFFLTNPRNKEAHEGFQEYQNIIKFVAAIVRYTDDLGTSSDELKRGDVPKSIQCYMHETGASEEYARQNIQELITTTLLKMNKEQIENPHLSNTFKTCAVNMMRISLCVYEHGDGHGIETREAKDRVLSLLINPIP